ncbi:MAG: flavin reductase family protein [Chloroflexaceae bacterium]|nr:flavin reductase family protein [Chloroflexaceae bacterium]
MSHFASGVTVVTTAVGNERSGMTVSAFASLSLEPPLVLVCLHQQAGSHHLIQRAERFAVNMLAEDQEYLSRCFASHHAEKFVEGSYTISEEGLPLLKDALATIECRLVNVFPGGDHSIFVGHVLRAETSQKCRPLLYYRSGYHQLD